MLRKLKSSFTLLYGFLFVCNLVYAQNIDKGLTTSDYKIFTSVEEALLNPDEVKYLSLKHKKLRTLPIEIYQFKNLEILDISRNRLEEIPSEIEKFNHLKEINVANNNLTTLPIQIGQLIQLKKILASQNNIALLPNTIGNLSNLEMLDLWSNEIESFPEEISALKQLKFVDLRGIMLSDEQKQEIRLLLPATDIQFSMGCNCLK